MINLGIKKWFKLKQKNDQNEDPKLTTFGISEKTKILGRGLAEHILAYRWSGGRLIDLPADASLRILAGLCNKDLRSYSCVCRQFSKGWESPRLFPSSFNRKFPKFFPKF